MQAHTLISQTVIRAINPEADMYKMHVIYPKSERGFFDWGHYIKVHVPMSIKALNRFTQFNRLSISKPVPGDTSEAFHCIGTVYFDNADQLEGFYKLRDSEYMKKVADDISNYTDCDPIFFITSTSDFLPESFESA
ncbi:EthD family reductase [Parasphingopyxis algicola]|uniref:EthD family reductase n=1 Tax=Parasphingopyxis algicola TaxID=2026624 RepID=UPI0015A46B9C|nr:EthD family reductase [Parasphingopyxis algicola]QLC25077.1 EthD family reductase [Parasphingopyxis algicola]